ncbi:WecB/TagA/CpsF family glycosyltransferase [Streptosporangium sp. LJ11]|uniref:WecB/TagA/CpsF family glycosyltransferase n=1 Tax=Streptosporangium sp. LJ11 TaxID=3436927 RepID=UPI003F798E07
MYADGISVVWSIRRKYGARLERIAGIDLWHALMRHAGRDQVPVFPLGACPEVVAVVEQRLKDEWQVSVVGTQAGSSPRVLRHAFRRVSRSRWLIHFRNRVIPEVAPDVLTTPS